MRWFVDVSRVGEDTKLVEKFVLEAKQWQAALQEARKRRGDTGPLSTFSIELLDNGYRAVDPSQQIRYAVHKAPADTPLSGDGAPGAFPAVPMEPRIAEQANATDPMAAPPPSKSDPSASGPKTDPMASLPPESAPSTARMNDKPAASLPVSNTERMTSSVVSETASTKPNPVAPGNESRPISTSPPEAQRMPAPVVTPPRPEIPDESPNSAPFTQTKPAVSPPASMKTVESVEVAQAPDFLVVKKREEEPNEKVPIRYREYAYAVKPGTDRKAVEVLLWLRFREVQESLKEFTGRRFVQLAVFDHVFSTKPARSPIATLAWKDWRGDPVVQLMDPRPASIPAPAAVSQPPRPESAAPSRAESPGPSAAPLTTPSRPHHSAPPTASVAPASSAPAATPNVAGSIPPASAPIIEVTATESIPAPPSESVPAPKPVEPTVGAPAERVGASTDPAITQQSIIIAPEPKVDVPEPTQPAIETPKKKAKRRRASDDLIGELFEKMHELHFSPDMVTGVEFVLGVLNTTLPSEGVVVHVYDINTRQFVIVRALGPSPQSVVLHRTPDSDLLFKKGMRATRCLRTANAKTESAYADGRFSLLGVAPTSALFGPVSLGGRYLGAVELLNPPGGEPFTENEANALDYICEQLAEFLASRPIVLDPDVVVGKS